MSDCSDDDRRSKRAMNTQKIRGFLFEIKRTSLSGNLALGSESTWKTN